MPIDAMCVCVFRPSQKPHRWREHLEASTADENEGNGGRNGTRDPIDLGLWVVTWSLTCALSTTQVRDGLQPGNSGPKRPEDLPGPSRCPMDYPTGWSLVSLGPNERTDERAETTVVGLGCAGCALQ